ncbi:hypothetical protein CEXT_813101 [Caerostris extrusa]|uniref:Uncharacterized protein n=1 Tax=Caerostris extrusa TaxID=172846 RepID=A0AAV4QXC3_CAEEX|nr:hypothetical protein CEXT_813101 [Caerostris extrusa]
MLRRASGLSLKGFQKGQGFLFYSIFPVMAEPEEERRGLGHVVIEMGGEPFAQRPRQQVLPRHGTRMHRVQTVMPDNVYDSTQMARYTVHRQQPDTQRVARPRARSLEDDSFLPRELNQEELEERQRWARQRQTRHAEDHRAPVSTEEKKVYVLILCFVVLVLGMWIIPRYVFNLWGENQTSLLISPREGWRRIQSTTS